MIIDYKKVREINTECYMNHYRYAGYSSPLDDTHHFAEARAKKGGEHYQLLTYLASLFNDIIILDVGTNWGDSAICLSQNPRNKVITYDIEHIWNYPFAKDFPNLEFRLMDINKENVELIKSAKLIFLDIAHDGFQEQVFTDMLKKIDYKGFVLCDDIHIPWSPQMKVWWNSIDIEKYDITDIGHSWGTGLINFNQDNQVRLIK